MLRLLLLFFNPPNNAYDDHLEPIAYYINHHQRPAPNACWECYQPSLYYVVAAGVYQAAFFVSKTYFTAWKAVQGINTLLSIGTLVLLYRIIRQAFSKQRQVVLLLIALAAVQPRDLYASAMITNDYLLIYLATLSVWLFLCYTARQNTKLLVGLCLSSAACALTKQHGLIVLLLPASILIHSLLVLPSWKDRFKLTPPLLLPVLAIGLGLSDEVWKFQTTHVLLVSNQHFFDYAHNQPPGHISKIDFHSWQLNALFQSPLLDRATWSSYWTALFASTWFDYEYRYVTPQLQGIKTVAGMLYAYGAGILALTAVGAVKLLLQARKNRWYTDWKKITLLAMGVAFFLVPFVQTLRLPHYSSMKSQFLLPASSIFLLLLGYGLREVKMFRTSIVYGVVSLTLVIGISHIIYVVMHLPQALGALSGPLWQFPHLNF